MTSKIFSQLQLGSGRRHTRWSRFPLRRRPHAVKKALFPEQNHPARRKSQTFILRFPGFSTPFPVTTFSLLTSNERNEEALRRRRSSTLSPLYRDLGWEGTATWRASPSTFSHFFSKQCLLHEPCLGVGHGLKMGAVRRRMQTLPGNRDLL